MMKSPISLIVLALAVLCYVSNGVAGKHLKWCAKKRGRTRATKDICDKGRSMFNVESGGRAWAAGVEKGPIICLRHREEVDKFDNRCTFLHVTPKQLTRLHLPERLSLYQAVAGLSRETSHCYRPGTICCMYWRKTEESILKGRIPEQYKAPAKRQVHLYLWECKSKIACGM